MKMFLMLAVLALPALPAASQTPVLKPATLVRGAVVHLGDLVENAGAHAGTPLFRAPDLGGSGIIRADRVQDAARELGLGAIDLRGITVVSVRRPARAVTAEEVTASLRKALQRKDPALADAALKLDAGVPLLSRDALDDTALQAEIIAVDRNLERFEAHVRLPGPGHEPLRLAGSLDHRLAVPVPTRDIPRGDTIQPGDLRMEQRLRREIPAGALIEPTRLAGLVARKALKSGQPLREGDVVRPDMVERNQPVTVLYESAGMTLSLRGKALASGAEGAIVPVQNLQSKRTLEAIVIGPGRVSIRHPASE